jgi:hypothetical protein
VSKIILDHIENIELDQENPPAPNLHAISYLPLGLYVLATNVRSEEIKIAESIRSKPMEWMMGRGYRPNWGLMSCFHHWFSVSVVNYVRLVGFVSVMKNEGLKVEDIRNSKQNADKVRKGCNEYVKRVIPDIHTWRNKISAHFAITDPRGEDNLGTLAASVMAPTCYADHHIKVNVLQFITEQETSNIPTWGLSEEYEKLTKRYWPNKPLQKLETNGLPPISHFLPS